MALKPEIERPKMTSRDVLSIFFCFSGVGLHASAKQTTATTKLL